VTFPGEEDVAVEAFDDGTVVFKQGDLSGMVYLVLGGAVRITKLTPSGEVATLGTIGENGIFGEMALIDSTRRMATATAVGTTSCLALEAAQLTKQLDHLSGDALQQYHDMLAYIRGTLPFDARTVVDQIRGETDNDRAARRRLAALPGVIADRPDLPAIVRAVLEVLAVYVQRRLPAIMT
jgi:CRP-like cAMP-binding protein